MVILPKKNVKNEVMYRTIVFIILRKPPGFYKKISPFKLKNLFLISNSVLVILFFILDSEIECLFFLFYRRHLENIFVLILKPTFMVGELRVIFQKTPF